MRNKFYPTDPVQYKKNTPDDWPDICMDMRMTAKPQPTLLVIDDDPLFHQIIRQRLTRELPDGQLSYSLSAKPIMEMLAENRHNSALLPDIIFLDLHMPEFSGLNFLQYFEMLESSLAKPIRIYILSSSADVLDRLYCRAFTAVKGFFSKISDLELVAKVPFQSSQV